MSKEEVEHYSSDLGEKAAATPEKFEYSIVASAISLPKSEGTQLHPVKTGSGISFASGFDVAVTTAKAATRSAIRCGCLCYSHTNYAFHRQFIANSSWNLVVT